MKKFGWVFCVLIVCTALAGLFLKNSNKNGYEKTEFLFDTPCTVTAYGKDAKIAVEAVFERLAEIHKVTDAFSETSDVARINSAESGEEIFVCQDVADILSRAETVTVDSRGAFDVTVASVSALWNFSGEGRVPQKEEIEKALDLVGRDIFDGKNVVKKALSDEKIDLGGAAKGFGGDAALEVLRGYDVSGAIVDLGGNICCMGTNPKTENGMWRIGVQKPFSPTGEFDEVVEISEGSVVTSGTYQRYFEKDKKLYHHIIDPKTGYPADRDYSSVTIVTEEGSCCYADCLATACFVLGREDGEALAEKYGAKIIFK